MMSNELKYDPDTGHILAGISCVKGKCAWWTGEQCAVTALAVKKSEFDQQYDFFLRMLKEK